MRPRAAAAAALAALATAAVLLILLAPLAAGDPAPSQHDPAAVRDRADEILERDEFQPADDSLIDQAWDWIVDHFPGDSDSDGPTSEGGGSGGGASISGGSSILTVVLLVLAVVGIGFVLRTLLGQPRGTRLPREDPVAIDVEERRTPDEWADAAARHEAAGEWKAGLRCRFRSLVERLIAVGAVPDIPGRTSGELRGDLRATTPPAADAFDEAAVLFERAWYGDIDTGPDEARRFATLAEQILAATRLGATTT